MTLEPPGAAPPGGSFKLDSKWIIVGVVVLGVLVYYIWNQQSKKNTNSANNPSSLNVNAEIAPVSKLDQWPQNQLVGMNQLALPGVIDLQTGQPVYG